MASTSAGRTGADRRRAFELIERAVADLAEGKAVVVVDDEDRENEGDLIFAAEKATPELVSFTVRYTSGYVCVALTDTDCDRLD
ncbi:3,4-dihydroxy-2-butanone-4-phosphate synthase, partial [Pseudonocardia sp. SCN 73-27]